MTFVLFYEDHWSALSRLIDLMRRAGQLESAEEFIKKAETQNPNANMMAGYNYCKGLHLWYVKYKASQTPIPEFDQLLARWQCQMLAKESNMDNEKCVKYC